MTSSMVWFPPPDSIDPQMQEVLRFEKKVLGSLGSALLTLGVMFACLSLILYAFWQRSLKTAMIILNLLVVGKLVLSLIFTGEAGWGTPPVTLFGLILINLIGFVIYKIRKKKS